MNAPLRGRAWIELDRLALAKNVEALRRALPAGCALMPAVKANAYGHGAGLVAKELQSLGISAFCVAAAQEGAELREAGISGEILVLGYTPPEAAPFLSQYRLTQTVPDPAYGKALNAQGKRLPVQIKIDTGMHRLGIAAGQFPEIASIFGCENLVVTGAYTHLCASGGLSSEDRACTLAQGRAFWAVAAGLRGRGLSLPKAHILASYGLAFYPDLGGDCARVGIALYGMLSTAKDSRRCPFPLRPVLSLKARVAQVKNLGPGESAGYDRKFAARRETRLAVLSIGYGDGLPRSLSCGAGSVLLHGKRAPIAGLICMDQTLVDVTDIPGAAPGDTAVIIGRSGEMEQTACGLAQASGTIANELLSRLGPRLERMWGAACLSSSKLDDGSQFALKNF